MKQKYIDLAIVKAQQGMLEGEIPIGAIIVYKNQVIAQSYNLKEKLNCSTRHAEIIAIEEASKKIGNWRLNDCEMYVTMEPCIMCCGALIQARVKKVYYLLDNRKFGGLGSIHQILEKSNNNHSVEIEKIENSVLECKYKEILREFFEDKR